MKRYYTMVAPSGRVAHMAEKRMDGDSTYCGIRMQAGWGWTVRDRTGLPRCKRCDATH